MQSAPHARIGRTVALLIVLGCAAVLPVSASCVDSVPVFTDAFVYIDPDGRYGYSNIPNLTPRATAVFWALGAGHPFVGIGNDSGALPANQVIDQPPHYVYPGENRYYYYPAHLSSDWNAAPSIDGCVANAGATPALDGDECTAVLLSDQLAHREQGYFAFLTVANSDGQFDLSPFGNIQLAPLAPLFIEFCDFNECTIRSPDSPEDGIFLDPACGPQSVVGYRIYQQNTGQFDPPPGDRVRDNGDPLTGWRVPVGGQGALGEPIPLGTDADVKLRCPAPVEENAWLTYSLVFRDGFETSFVSQDTLLITCSPCSHGDNDGDLTCAPWDCDDTNPDIYPGAVERCNGIDDNCNSYLDDEPLDVDRDGHGDVCDNCSVAHNRPQTDLDLDGEGDHCDRDDGWIYLLFSQQRYVEWLDEQGFDSWNLYRGDVDLLGTPGGYTQPPGSNPLAGRICGASSPFADSDPPPGKAAFYLVAGVSGGIEDDLGTDSDGFTRPNTAACPP